MSSKTHTTLTHKPSVFTGNFSLSLAMAILLVGILLPHRVLAQDNTRPPPTTEQADLPPASELFDAYIEAVGGMDAIKSDTNRTMHGIYKNAKTGESQILTIYAQAPNKLRAEVEIPAIGNSIRATDGTTVWGTNISGTPFILKGNEKDEFLDSADYYGEANYKERYTSIKTAGTAKINNADSYFIEFTTKEGLKGYVFFDKKTKLLSARMILHDDGTPDTLVLVQGYKNFNGLLIPTRQQQRHGKEIISYMEYRKIENNVDSMPNFSPPEGLLEASK